MRNVFKNKPKTGSKLEIEGVQILGGGSTMKVVFSKSHGEGGIFENI